MDYTNRELSAVLNAIKAEKRLNGAWKSGFGIFLFLRMEVLGKVTKTTLIKWGRKIFIPHHLNLLITISFCIKKIIKNL